MTLNDCKRCGLNKESSDKLEALKVKRLVCARLILPDGPADGKVEVDGKPVTSIPG